MSVPKVVHFIYTHKNASYGFVFTNYLCVLSAIHHNPGYRVMFWSDMTMDEIEQHPWVSKLIGKVEFRSQEMPKEIYGQPLKYAAHMSDIVRIQKLQQYGGIYLDTDILTVRSYDDLLDTGSFIVGRENKKLVGQAVMMAEPGFPLFAEWLERYKNFTGSEFKGHDHYRKLKDREERKKENLLWAGNSLHTLTEILPKYEGVRVLDRKSFYFPHRHFTETVPFNKDPDLRIPEAYGHHLCFSGNPKLKTLTPEKIGDGYFGKKVKEFFI